MTAYDICVSATFRAEISGLRVPFVTTQTHQFLYVFPPGVEVFLRLAQMIFVADLFDQELDQLGNIRALK